MERGGRASKLGNSYERLWAVRQALEVIDGRARSLIWEALGDDGNGIDLWVTDSDGKRIGYQVKCQNHSKEIWSVSDLRTRGVLQYARDQLDRDINANYVFVSSCGVRDLKDLAEMSRRTDGDSQAFHRDIVSVSSERNRAFLTLMATWHLQPNVADDLDHGFRLLQRMRFLVWERDPSVRVEVSFLADKLVDGPGDAVAVIGDFLKENLGTTLHADSILARLREEGFQFRNLAGDRSLPAAIEELQISYDNTISDTLIAGVPIARPEVSMLISEFSDSQAPRIIFVHGQAGSGKSVVLHQFFKALSKDGVPCLPIQLHVCRPEGLPRDFGRSKLGLNASPAQCLRGLAGCRHAVLLLDQLDALRLTGAHSLEVWESCSKLIDEALADPQTTIVVACRSFDLEHDPNIKAWKQRLQGKSLRCFEIKVEDLPEKEVSELLKKQSTDFASLPARQRKLLLQPSTLALWWKLTSSDRKPTQFTTATQLMREVLMLLRSEASRVYHVTTADVNEVIERLVRTMERDGRLDAPQSLISEFALASNALCSVGLLEQHDTKLAFVHQVYFDHLVAQRVLREVLEGSAELEGWISAKQSLFHRDQIRQLATLLRDDDVKLHERLLRRVLLQPGVRFHLKHLVFGLLGNAEPPLEHEVRLVTEMAEDAAMWTHLQDRVLWSKIAWFDALYTSGHIATWLAKWTDDQAVRSLLRLFRMISASRGHEIDELLEPYWNASEPWPERLSEISTFDPADDSSAMSNYRIEHIRSGEWRFDDLSLDRLAKNCPERVVPSLEAAIEAWLNATRDYMREQEKEEAPRWQLSEERIDSQILAAIRADACRGWVVFSRTLRTLSTLRRMLNRRTRTLGDFANQDWRLSTSLDSAREFIEPLLIAAVKGMSNAHPEEMTRLLTELTVVKIRGLERATACGLVEGPDEIADEVIAWLCARSSRFRLGDDMHETRWEPARALIERFSPACSESSYGHLENTILGYHDASEYESFAWQWEAMKAGYPGTNTWGRAQNVLLGALPDNRTLDRANDVRREWERKFGDPANENPGIRTGILGTVRSPIPPSRIANVSDREWLRIIQSDLPEHKVHRFREHGSGIVGEASVRHFSETLGEATKRDPGRFAELMLKMPCDSDPQYFSAILRSLGQDNPEASGDTATIEQLEACIAHVRDLDDGECIRAICWVVKSREARWSDEIVQTILDHVNHADPTAGYFPVRSLATDDKESIPNVLNSALNCVRGVIAGTLVHLLWVRPDAYDRLLAGVKRLVDDPHPSVRGEALGACIPIMNRDKDLAVQMAIDACNYDDDRLFAGRWIDRIIYYARATHGESLEPIIQRMARSSIEAVAESGAVWATAIWLDTQRLASLHHECRAGTKPQRLGVTQAATDFYTHDAEQLQCLKILVGMFNFPDPDVRQRAAVVFSCQDVFDINATVELASRFVESKAFLDSPAEILHPLTEFSGNLMQFSDVILTAAEVMSGPFAEETRSMRNRNAFAGDELSVLLMRLYEIAYGTRDEELQRKCLDKWDSMLESRLGMTEQHLNLIDN